MTRHGTLTRRGLVQGSVAGAFTSVWSLDISAQTARRIEQFDPALEAIVATSEPVRILASGLAGEPGPTEGPVWWKEGGYLLFSDMHNDKRLKYAPEQGVSVFKEGVSRTNGMTRDLQGRLVTCETESRRVTRQENDGTYTTIANNYKGQRFNRPNDAVVKSDGSIYFTDPILPGAPVPEPWDVTFPGVYRVSPDLGSITLLIDTMISPNGLAFSPDEKVLYIDDTRPGHIKAFDMLPNGMLAKHTERVFADLRGPDPGVPDGMKVDSAGNVYCGGSGGIWIVDSSGKKLGRIVHGAPATTNIAFGGDDWRTLYFTTRNSLGAVNLKISGTPVPVTRKR